MVVAFFGHSRFYKTEEYERKIFTLFEEYIGDQEANLFLGGYGEFDYFAYECSKKFKETHPKISLVFVTPYLSLEYQKRHLDYQKVRYDSIIYPEIENKPQKYAIIYRNRYMVEKADFIIAYITHNWGGAYKAYEYAKRMNKRIYNISGKKI